LTRGDVPASGANHGEAPITIPFAAIEVSHWHALYDAAYLQNFALQGRTIEEARAPVARG
jgi:hypothetical protein